MMISYLDDWNGTMDYSPESQLYLEQYNNNPGGGKYITNYYQSNRLFTVEEVNSNFSSEYGGGPRSEFKFNKKAAAAAILRESSP